MSFNAFGVVFDEYLGIGTTPVAFYALLFASMCATYIGFDMIERAAAKVNQDSDR